ncbi:hypothetical protein [Burkholderia vietnamiensis]|uniref:hypothetical protein n=1 Tax=Burkholderia vietnamiensis TaxID=60552 RepID=UPI0012D98FBD|nr:hypothetical protein [Burkholderia vietnamiensis]
MASPRPFSIFNGCPMFKPKDAGTTRHQDTKESKSATKKTGTFADKSNKLGHGGRATQRAKKNVPDGVIGEIARYKGATPSQPNFHGKQGKATKK